jgi:hypothetical protein
MELAAMEECNNAKHEASMIEYLLTAWQSIVNNFGLAVLHNSMTMTDRRRPLG